MKVLSLEKISDKESWKIRGLLFGFILLGILVTKFYPLHILHQIFPETFSETSPCIMLNLTGVPCPFCGLSRSFTEILNLDFSKSIYFNPSSVIIFPFLALLCLSIFVLSFFNYKISFRLDKKTFIVLLLVLISIWLINIYYGHH